MNSGRLSVCPEAAEVLKTAICGMSIQIGALIVNKFSGHKQDIFLFFILDIFKNQPYLHKGGKFALDRWKGGRYDKNIKNTPPGRGRNGGEMQADKNSVLRLLKTARGQIDGIIKMVEENRYCMDISHQLMASEAVLKKANKVVLTAHLKGCIEMAETEEERDEKIEELIKTLDKIMK